MNMPNKAGSVAGITLSVLLVGVIGANHAGNSSDDVTITYDELVSSNRISISEQQPESPDTVTEITISTTSALSAPVSTTAATSVTESTPKTTTAASAAATNVTTEPDIIEDQITITVYVSNSGKYHSKSNCSGMKNYTEMSLDEALDAGHVACKKCW